MMLMFLGNFAAPPVSPMHCSRIQGSDPLEGLDPRLWPHQRNESEMESR